MHMRPKVNLELELLSAYSLHLVVAIKSKTSYSKVGKHLNTGKMVMYINIANPTPVNPNSV